MSYVPFLVAARAWDGPSQFDDAWKINTFGDPLMLCPPPDAETSARLEPAQRDELDLAAHVEVLLRRVESDEAGEAITEAIRTASLLGRDDVAVQIWRLAKQRGFASSAAPAALSPLFRQKEVNEFLAAWQAHPVRDDLSVDMLWHLIGPTLGRTTSPETLILLQSAIRPYQSHIDVERLEPHLVSAFGSTHVKRVIQREIESVPNRNVRAKLQALLRKY